MGTRDDEYDYLFKGKKELDFFLQFSYDLFLILVDSACLPFLFLFNIIINNGRYLLVAAKFIVKLIYLKKILITHFKITKA